MSKVYTYRTTTEKLGAAYEHIESSGHSVEHCVFQGGRDFVLVCREAERVGALRG